MVIFALSYRVIYVDPAVEIFELAVGFDTWILVCYDNQSYLLPKIFWNFLPSHVVFFRKRNMASNFDHSKNWVTYHYEYCEYIPSKSTHPNNTSLLYRTIGHDTNLQSSDFSLSFLQKQKLSSSAIHECVLNLLKKWGIHMVR